MAVTGVLKKCADCGTVFVAETRQANTAPAALPAGTSPAPPVGMDTESRPRMP